MYIRAFYSSILIFLLILLLPAAAILAEDNLISNNQSGLPSQEEKGMRYISALDQNTLERQYKDLMAGRGFTYRKDKDLRGPPLRRLYFEKDNLTVDVTLRALKGKGTEVFMDKYINSEVIIDAKDVLPYMKNPTIELPKYKPNNLSQAASYKPLQDEELGILDLIMETPVPPESKVSNEEVPDPLLGVGGSGTVYQSDINPKEVEGFYRAALKKLGFREKEDMGFKVMKFKRLRFESNSMAVELYLSPRGEKGSRFIVIKYMDKDGVSKVEANPLYMVKLPENDNAAGSDLEDVPRPTDSVRQSGGTGKDRNSVSYITPIKVLAVRDFYKQKMPSLGWKLSKEVNIGADNDKYAKEHKGVGFISSVPLGAKIDLGDIIKNSHILEFKSNAATVRIAIYPNYINTAAGSMVDIEYAIAKNQGGR